MRLDLGDALHIVFHRVFHCDNLLQAAIDSGEHAVEGSGLAAASRACHQHNAVGHIHPVVEQRDMIRKHADIVDTVGAGFLGQ